MARALGAMKVDHEGVNLKEKLLKAINGREKNHHPLWGQVLVGVYNRFGYDDKADVKMKSGLYLPQTAAEEDKWQGKVGLILALGPYAFRGEDGQILPGSPKIGDWVHFRVGDTLGSMVDKMMIRYVDHELIKAIIDDPDALY